MADSVVSRLLGVLVGDSDPSGFALTVIAIGVPKLGSASITGGGASVTYSPSADGVDVFTYTISNGHGGTATATLRVTVTAGGCKGCVVIRPPGG